MTKRQGPAVPVTDHDAPEGAVGRADILERANCGRYQPSGILGGAGRDRTDDLMLAKHALSQLSYGPWESVGRQSMASHPL